MFSFLLLSFLDFCWLHKAYAQPGFLIGGGGELQITCNDVIRNFQERIFLQGKDIVEWKI